MPTRFILRCRQPENIQPAQVDRITQIPGVKITEQSPKMLFVEGEEGILRDFVEANPEWILAPEVKYSVPDPRYRAKPQE
jgi:hypothetical protein